VIDLISQIQELDCLKLYFCQNVTRNHGVMKNLIKLLIYVLLVVPVMGVGLGFKSQEAKSKIESITIPVIRLEKASLDTAVKLLRSRSIELDSSSLDPKKKGILIYVVHQMPEVDVIQINYSHKQVMLKSALIDIAKQTEMDLYLTSIGVVFCTTDKHPFPNTISDNGEIFDVLFKNKNS